MTGEAFKAKVYGRVQGVGFRYFVIYKAKEFGIAGYTKNLIDGSVEVYAEGEKLNLEMLLEALKAGPSMSRVDNVEVDWLQVEQNYQDFKIAY
jgi:acylphosphatase